MKKLLIILLTTLTFTAKAQNNQFLELRFPYHKEEVFQWENFDVSAQYFFGKESVKWGAFATASFKENDYLFGINNRTLLVSVVGANIFIEGGIAVLADKSDNDSFGEPYHQHYAYYAIRLSYPIKHNLDFNYGFEQQYWSNDPLFISGVGVSYTLK